MKPRQRKRQVITPEIKAEIQKLLKEDYPIRSIADFLGISAGAVFNVKKEMK